MPSPVDAEQLERRCASRASLRAGRQTVSGSTSRVIVTAGPIQLSRPIVDVVDERRVDAEEAVVADRAPSRRSPTCEAMKTLSPIVEWWPMWLPLQRTQLSPIVTNGWIVLSSKMKQCSPSSTLRHTNARLET